MLTHVLGQGLKFVRAHSTSDYYCELGKETMEKQGFDDIEAIRGIVLHDLRTPKLDDGG